MPSEKFSSKDTKKNNFIDGIKAYCKKEVREGDITKALQRWNSGFKQFISNIKSARNVAKNNYDLGKKHYELGNFGDAVMRFKLVTWLEPKQSAGWLWLGKSYVAAENIAQARGALLKALEINPDLQEAKELLKAASVAK